MKFLIFALLLFISIASLANDAEPFCVIKSRVELRKGPSSKYAKTWSVPKYMPLFKLEQKGSWVKVQDMDGQSHWVRANALSKKISCAVVKTKTAKLRRGPGPDQPLAEFSSADKYTAFLKTDRDGEWIQVKDDFNGSFWVHETNVWMPVARARVSF